jgi:trimethylguanosine synthase
MNNGDPDGEDSDDGAPVLDEQSAAEMAMLAAMGLPVSFGAAKSKSKAPRARAAPRPTELAGRAPPSGTYRRFDEEEEAGAETQAGPSEGAGPSASESPGFAVRAMPAGVPPKYWAQRYRLFSRYDEGAALHGDMWFSVTPEAAALHQAQRALAGGAHLVVDAFAGAGGNTVAFARAGGHALGVDTDADRLRAAAANATLYGVRGRCDFVRADWNSLSAAMARHRPLGVCTPDLLFLSPPWGGPDYLAAERYDLTQRMAGEADAAALLRGARALAPRVAFFLPRNVAAADAAALADAAAPGERAELEDMLLNGVKKACTLYVGLEAAQQRGQRIVCELCGTGPMTSIDELEAHRRGTRHAAKAKQEAETLVRADTDDTPMEADV